MITTKKLPIKIGFSSCVGVYGEAPHEFGNYFSLADGTCILNMWEENLTAANAKFKLRGEVQVRLYQEEGRQWGLIDDPRIPASWYNNKLCFTGASRVPVEFARDMYEYLGDPNNEFEQFTNPKEYWRKKGCEYSETSDVESPLGIVSCKIKAVDRKLKAEWTYESY